MQTSFHVNHLPRRVRPALTGRARARAPPIRTRQASPPVHSPHRRKRSGVRHSYPLPRNHPDPQDNVEQVLLLADKYDMPIVRGFCAHFLALHSSSMALHEPLSSARNPLRAASLADRYCSTSTELSAYRLSVDLALTTCLSAFDRVNATAAAQPSNNNNASSFPAAAPSSSFGFGARTQPQQQQQQQPTGLFGPAAPASSSNPSSPAPATPGASDASRALAHLEKLVNDACYMTTVTPSVQVRWVLFLPASLRSLRPYVLAHGHWMAALFPAHLCPLHAFAQPMGTMATQVVQMRAVSVTSRGRTPVVGGKIVHCPVRT